MKSQCFLKFYAHLALKLCIYCILFRKKYVYFFQRVVTSIEESIRNFSEEQEETIQSDSQVKIKRFLHEYIDLCWLFTIAHPRLHLKFDVVDKPYSDIREHFSKYSSQDRVKDESKVKDSVYCVVWPCVILEDASGIIVKGSVMTVDIGKEEWRINSVNLIFLFIVIP